MIIQPVVFFSLFPCDIFPENTAGILGEIVSLILENLSKAALITSVRFFIDDLVVPVISKIISIADLVIVLKIVIHQRFRFQYTLMCETRCFRRLYDEKVALRKRELV